MIISVASGKGGTGKTTVATNLALSIPNAQILDCDVEEPNSYIFIKPEIEKREVVFSPVPEVDFSLCNLCGKCQEVCAYNAITIVGSVKDKPGNSGKKLLTFPELCHGCGACTYFCPQAAIKETGKEIGFVETGSREGLRFAHGSLKIGEIMAPPLIKAVKKHIEPDKTVIIDAPPGTSCPVITAIKETGFVILVTEPTPFGLNDLILAAEVVKILNIPFGVVINRSDFGNKDTESYCLREGIPILMRIPFRKEIAVAYSKGIPAVEISTGYKRSFQKLFSDIQDGKFS